MAVTLVAYIMYAAHNDPFFFRAAVAANIAGIVMAALAALPGFVDWAIGIPSESPAKSRGLSHMLPTAYDAEEDDIQHEQAGYI